MADDPATRNRRWRAHAAGEHFLCLRRNCPDAPPTPAPEFVSTTVPGERAAAIVATYPNAIGAGRLLVTQATDTAGLIDHLELTLADNPGELAIVRELGAQRRLLTVLLNKLADSSSATPPKPLPSWRDHQAALRDRDALERALS